MVERRPNVKDILRKYGSKIDQQIGTKKNYSSYSGEYVKFKNELAPILGRYERLCKGLGSLIKLKVSEKDESDVRRHLKIAHVDVEPWQALNLAVFSFLVIFFLGILISVSAVLIGGGISSFPFLFFFLDIIVGLFLFYFVKAYPARLANKWRLKASSQMVPAILYLVVYMRHTPNLEKAVSFASEHLEPPLALDLRRVFYEVEVGKFSTMKESLDNYLETWRDYSPEFIEAFHLIEGSLYEPDNSRRIATLEKSLQVILDGVYDKMLKFTHGVRSPLTNVYMLGVVLPTLGLALLPLASAMLGSLLKWYHVLILFNLIVPFFVFYLTDKIIFLRPGGYGETKLLEKNPKYSEYRSNKHFYRAFFIALPFFVIGILPLLFGFTPLPEMLNMQKDFTFTQIGLGFFGDQSFFGFGENGSGPFGMGALVLGMFFPLGVAIFFSSAYKSKTKNLILARNATRELEREFNNSLFALGNRIGNGSPPEIAFGKVAETSRGLRTEEFFRRVSYNIRQLGMGIEKAIFDSSRGAIVFFPSDLIATSMRILIESAKKGLKIAANGLMSISEYVKNIQKINQRLKDVLSEIASDMKSNMTFLAPLLSGIVVGLAAMITSILTKLSIADGLESANIGFNLDNVLSLFNVSEMVPPYFLQIIVGIYLIQIIFILTRTLVTVDSGEDNLERFFKLSKNLRSGVMLYFITALLSTIVLFVLSVVVLQF